MSDHLGCIGFTDSTLTIPCPEPVTCEVRLKRDGRWRVWSKMCARHADHTVGVLSEAEGFEVERRPLCPECAATLREGMAPVEITVSTQPPLVASPYTTEPFVCPHKVTYWIEPTSEQIARWQAEGVA